MHGQVWEHPDSEKLWCEMIDVGEDEPRQILSGDITLVYTYILQACTVHNRIRKYEAMHAMDGMPTLIDVCEPAVVSGLRTDQVCASTSLRTRCSTGDVPACGMRWHGSFSALPSPPVYTPLPFIPTRPRPTPFLRYAKRRRVAVVCNVKAAKMGGRFCVRRWVAYTMYMFRAYSFCLIFLPNSTREPLSITPWVL